MRTPLRSAAVMLAALVLQPFATVTAQDIPAGAFASLAASVHYLLALEQSGQAWPDGLRRPLIAMKVGPIQMEPTIPQSELYYTEGEEGPLPSPQFAGLDRAADPALFPAPPNGGQLIWTAFGAQISFNVGFLATLDFFAEMTGDFTVMRDPVWWDHPAASPGMLGQINAEAGAPFFDTPSREQGNPIPTLASMASDRGGIIQIAIEHVRPSLAASPADGTIAIPQRALSFVADGEHYVVEFTRSDGFRWSSTTAASTAVPVSTRTVRYPSMYAHRLVAIAVRTDATQMVDGVVHHVVHLHARNPGENFLPSLTTDDRLL